MRGLSPTRLLAASPRGLTENDQMLIYPDRARLDLLGKDQPRADIFGPDRGTESVTRVIGKRYSLLRHTEARKADHWAENLFLHDFHGVCAVAEDRGTTKNPFWVSGVLGRSPPRRSLAPAFLVPLMWDSILSL